MGGGLHGLPSSPGGPDDLERVGFWWMIGVFVLFSAGAWWPWVEKLYFFLASFF